jgi:hypothetical protein
MRISEEAFMRAMLRLVVSLSCAACTAPVHGPPSAVGLPPSATLISASPPPAPNCRQYTTPVLVSGKSETASGVACELADGSWRITDYTPGLPSQTYTMPPPGVMPLGSVPPLPGAPGQGQVAQSQADCREYTVPIVVGGLEKQGVGASCRQPDGSWRITDNTPGLPQQVYLVPPPTYPLPDDVPDYLYDPWYYGPPFALAGSFIFFDHFHHGGHFHHAHSGSSHPPSGHSPSGHSWSGGSWMGSGHHH